MIVDSHVHVMAADQARYPRQKGEMPEWMRDLEAGELLRMMDEARIDRAILVQSYMAYRDDNSYAADCAAERPERFVAVAIINPAGADAAQRLAYWVRERGVRGVRIVPSLQPGLRIDDSPMRQVLAQAAQLGIPVCLLARLDNLRGLDALLGEFPALPIALEHAGAPKLKDGPPYEAATELFSLARFPNLRIKFSSETIYTASKGKSTPREFFARMLASYGPRRLIWGSNFPATHDRGLAAQLEMARDALAFASAEDREWIFGGTALELWPTLAGTRRS